MPARRRSRQRALRALFEWDVSQRSAAEVIEHFYASLYTAEDDPDVEPPPPGRDPFMESLVTGTITHVAVIDELIGKKAENWRLGRMPIVDRNILRMAAYEMTHEGTPPAVVIDEALELARRYTEEEAIPFLNGVLDAVRREVFPE